MARTSPVRPAVDSIRYGVFDTAAGVAPDVDAEDHHRHREGKLDRGGDDADGSEGGDRAAHAPDAADDGRGGGDRRAALSDQGDDGYHLERGNRDAMDAFASVATRRRTTTERRPCGVDR